MLRLSEIIIFITLISFACRHIHLNVVIALRLLRVSELLVAPPNFGGSPSRARAYARKRRRKGLFRHTSVPTSCCGTDWSFAPAVSPNNDDQIQYNSNSSQTSTACHQPYEIDLSLLQCALLTLIPLLNLEDMGCMGGPNSTPCQSATPRSSRPA